MQAGKESFVVHFLSIKEIDKVIAFNAAQCLFWGPVRLSGRGRFSDTDSIKYRPLKSAADIEWNEKSGHSPKEVVFPVTQTMFSYVNGCAVEPPAPQKKQVLFCRACDMHAIARLDSIFLSNGNEPDSYYAQLRQNLHLVLLECAVPFSSCFCVAMGTNVPPAGDGVIRPDGEGYLLDTTSAYLQELFAESGSTAEAFNIKYPDKNGIEVHVPSNANMPAEIFNHPMWAEYSARCIACGRCNTSCPTCSCFSVFDTGHETGSGVLAERTRVWDGCHLDGFTDMAGGMKMRVEYGSRMRFKTLHKIYDFRKRFGKNMCVGCGRCDDVCPEMISFAHCISKVSDALALLEVAPHE